MAQFHPLKIAQIERTTPNAVVINFEIPENLKNDFHFIPGQYITIKKVLNGKELRRSYSICSNKWDETLSIGVKRVENGVFSVYANDELNVGDVLEIHPPEGRFIFNSNFNLQRNIIAYAAGSGITPVLSIIKELLKNEPKSRFVLVYGNRSIKETMFHNEINELGTIYKERFKIHYIYSRQKEEGALFGRIEASIVKYLTKLYHPSIDFDAVYLCGPSEMIKAIGDVLKDRGISESKIHTELFTTPDNEKSEGFEIPDGKTIVEGIVDDEPFNFIMDKEVRVLDAALKNRVDAPYSCQGGICSSCIARIKEGQVKMVQNQILTDSEIEEGLILTCQSHPITNKLVIDYDDV